jgi:hypothetical protein
MNPDILIQLRARLESRECSLDELHRAAVAAGSSWSIEQLGTLLDCCPDVVAGDGGYRLASAPPENPVTKALLSVASPAALPAAALVARLPPGVIATAAGLCEIARTHPSLELLPGNRIRRR